MIPFSRLLALVPAVAALVACAYQGGDIGDPLHRKLHWFSFVGGDDIAAGCQPGSPDRARLVYTAIWDRAVRIYEWDAPRRSLRIRAVGPGDLAAVRLDDPLAGWRAEEAVVALDPAALAGLDAALAESGGFGPPAVGLELPARSFNWTAATCHGGRFTFTGWLHPSPAFAAATFPARLLALDPGRDAVVPPGPVPFDPQWDQLRSRGAVPDFTLKVGATGLVR